MEFVYAPGTESFYFLEVNTRLQVEHAITEAVCGIDLVEWMILTAAGQPPSLTPTSLPTPTGAAIEVRLYAEIPLQQFVPSPGVLTEVVFPTQNVRVDGWVASGTLVTSLYDPMLAKLIVHATTREAAIVAMKAALANTHLRGIATNLEYLRDIVASSMFQNGDVSTSALNTFQFHPKAIEIIDPGTSTSVQDFPGRVGYWAVGVPPSGPMDDWSFRVANRIVGNNEHAAGLECTMVGPTIRFHADTIAALTGASSDARLDGAPFPRWQPVNIKAGQVLTVGTATNGCRTYLALRGGLDVGLYLGSSSTFALGHFGGHAGRTLMRFDMLALGQESKTSAINGQHAMSEPVAMPAGLVPNFQSHWDIGVLYGPHGAPDFFTPASIDEFFASNWEVHYNSNRLGVRLIGPKPCWARSDGGEAGLHPSNIHDCVYAIGSVNFTGDMPVILTRDGPSLGGFVCPATIASAELWKVGQLQPGHTVRFHAMTFDEALSLQKAQDAFISAGLNLTGPDSLTASFHDNITATARSHILHHSAPEGSSLAVGRPKTVMLQAGDKYILIEYGENVLDLNLRFRVHAMMEALARQPIQGIQELSPGVRSLQVDYNSRLISQSDIVRALVAADSLLTDVHTMRVPSRVLHLPMAFEDSATLDAVERYRATVREQAPWLPSNSEFIRRINGMPSIDAVQEIVFSTSYMVLGLGDVYLGAPCAVPVDPRHRLLTSKYNPARTFTAEGTVGIGGVYMCIYGMDSPGGYQLVGRTLPIWNTFLKNSMFVEGKPWLLRFFDQIRFTPVTESELEILRSDFLEGRSSVTVTDEIFDLAEYNAFLLKIKPELDEFKVVQKAAFDCEVARWATEDASLSLAMPAYVQANAAPSLSGAQTAQDPLFHTQAQPKGHVDAYAHISGKVWKIVANVGDRVEVNTPVVVLEAMKMELEIVAPIAGTIVAIFGYQGCMVKAGTELFSIVPLDVTMAASGCDAST